MSRLTDLSLANRSLAALATVIIAVAGVISALTLKQELIPSLQLPVLAAVTTVPGADADVVDAQVSRPVEAAAQSLDGVSQVSSTSATGLSTVSVSLDYGADVKSARAELQSAIAAISTLPQGAASRVVAGDIDDVPVLQLSAIAPSAQTDTPSAQDNSGTDTGSQANTEAGSQFVTALQEQVIPRLTKIAGVRDVQLNGAGTQQVTITLDPARAAAAGVTMDLVSAALAGNGVAVPAGSITQDANALNVQVGAPFSTVDEVAAIPIIGAVPTSTSTQNAPVRQEITGTCTIAVAGDGCTVTASGTTTSTCTREDRGIGECTATVPATTTSTTIVPGAAPPASTTTTTNTRTVTSTQRTTVRVPSYITVQAPAPTQAKTPAPTLGSVATVSFGTAPVSGYTRTDGQASITLGIRKTSAGNTVAISKAVRAELADLQNATGGRFSVVYDQAPYISSSISDLTTEGLLGLGFAILVVLIFLMSMRMTLVTALSIPLSLLIALIGLRVGGFSLNILTLGALTIAVGRVVDDSIVVIENVKRHVDAREDRLVAIPGAVREVAGAITSSTLATAAVFLPIGVVGGQVGELFRPFALTVVLALLASLLVALTIVPVLAYWLIKRKRDKSEAAAASPSASKSAARRPSGPPPTRAPGARPARPAGKASVQPGVGRQGQPAEAATEVIGAQPTAPGGPRRPGQPGVPSQQPVGETSVMPVSRPTPRPTPTAGRVPVKSAAAAGNRSRRPRDPDKPTVFDRIRKSYIGVLRAALRRPLTTLTLAVLVLAATVAGATQLKTDFLGGSGQNTLMITQELPAGTSLAATNTAAQKVEQVLFARSDVATYEVTVGADASGASAFLGGGGENTAQYYISLRDGVDAEQVTGQLRTNLSSRPELGSFTIGSGDAAGSSAVEVQITGSDTEKLQLAAERVYARVSNVSGASEVTNNLSGAVPSIKVTVNRQAAADLGLNDAAVGTLVSAALRGAAVGDVAVGGDPYAAVVVSTAKPATVDDLRMLPVAGTTLGAIASVEQVSTATTIQRVDGERTATVSAVPAGDDLGAFTDRVTAAVRAAKIPAGTTATIGGVSADQREAFSSLGWALLAAIALVYLVMVATFRSLVQPLLLLVSIPFAATGAIAGLLITRIPLGVAAIIGMLMLVGIVVTNAIVLVDLVNKYRRGGMTVYEALVTGGEHRLRPILMTALATILALVPMALSLTGGGAFISQPLAVVVIGGLFTSTLLTLVIVPVLYWLVEGRAERKLRRARALQRSAAPVTPSVRAGARQPVGARAAAGRVEPPRSPGETGATSSASGVSMDKPEDRIGEAPGTVRGEPGPGSAGTGSGSAAGGGSGRAAGGGSGRATGGASGRVAGETSADDPAPIRPVDPPTAGGSGS